MLNHLLTLLTTLAITCTLSLNCLANTGQADNNPREVIDDYRILRASCAQTQGNERRDCYARLNQQTEQYQAAKDRLKSAQLIGLRLTYR